MTAVKFGEWQPIEIYDSLDIKKRPNIWLFRFAPTKPSRPGVHSQPFIDS